MNHTGSSLDSLLREAFNSYRQGLLRPPPPPSFPSRRDISALLFLNNIDHVPLVDRIELHRLLISCQEGLAAARQGQLETASNHFQQAQLHLEILEESTRIARLLGASTYQSAVAYLDFKNDSYEKSRTRLEWAMNADLELELSGLSVLQIRRVQHGHNLARMDFHLKRRSAAIQLVGELVAYMEGQIDRLGYHSDWRPESLRTVPQNIVRAMIHEVVSETVGRIVTGSAPEKEWRILIEAACLCKDPDSAISPQAQYVLLAQSGRHVNAPTEYLLAMNRLFRIGIRRCNLLWYAVLVDLADFCVEMNTHYSRQIRDVLERDSSKWKGMPSFLRDRLIGMETQRKERAPGVEVESAAGAVAV
jgi:hypothetical protein